MNRKHSALENLRTDEFAARYSLLSSPRAVHRALQRSKAVEHVRLALCRGEITEDAIRDFTAELLRRLDYGRRHPHEFALAALAVALESRSTPFAEELVMDLARLELAEIPMAIRVARESCNERLNLPANKTKVFTLPDGEPRPTHWQTGSSPPPVRVGEAIGRFELETL
jgi:hypothetical protein